MPEYKHGHSPASYLIAGVPLSSDFSIHPVSVLGQQTSSRSQRTSPPHTSVPGTPGLGRITSPQAVSGRPGILDSVLSQFSIQRPLHRAPGEMNAGAEPGAKRQSPPAPASPMPDLHTSPWRAPRGCLNHSWAPPPRQSL